MSDRISYDQPRKSKVPATGMFDRNPAHSKSLRFTDITVGMQIEVVDRDENSSKFVTVAGLPYAKARNPESDHIHVIWWLPVRYQISGKTIENDRSLADMGVTPYDNVDGTLIWTDFYYTLAAE